MKKINSIVLLLLIIVAMFFIQSCNSEKSSKKFPETAFTSSDDLTFDGTEMLTIRLALNEVYCKKTACVCIHNVAAREYDELQEQLKSKFNIDLQITYFEETYDMEDELVNKTFDGVICKPWKAYMLVPKNGANYKRIVDVLDPFGNPLLKGIFIVRKDSPIKTMEDINGRTLVMGQADSYEKYHLPMRILKKEKITPSKIYEKSSCLESINEMIDYKAEIAVISDYSLGASCAVDVANPEDFRTIGETEEMPLTSVILDMDKVSEEDALRLQKALLALSGDNAPEGMMSKGFIKPVSWRPIPFNQ